MGIHLLLWPAHRAHILAWLSPRFFQDYICISRAFIFFPLLLTPPPPSDLPDFALILVWCGGWLCCYGWSL